MTQTARTPGPWDFDTYADHLSYFSDASKRKGDYDFRVEFPDDMPQAEAEANTLLIAAAPELLKALEMAVNNPTHPAEWMLKAVAEIDKVTPA